MSLINDALKKAQNVRYEEPLDPAAPAAVGGNKTRIAKRGRAHSANTTILLGSGAIVLVVLSVVATVYLVNRKPEPAVSVNPTAPRVTEAAPTPAMVAPKLDLPVVAPAAEATVAGSTAATTQQTSSGPAPSSAPLVIAPPAPPKPDEQTLRFVESIKVAGVRSTGNESRVLMNERVYRVNDVVERTLGLKLIGVAPSTLTFSDSAGATYVKNF